MGQYRDIKGSKQDGQIGSGHLCMRNENLGFENNYNI
jgi:hypothetical protein